MTSHLPDGTVCIDTHTSVSSLFVIAPYACQTDCLSTNQLSTFSTFQWRYIMVLGQCLTLKLSGATTKERDDGTLNPTLQSPHFSISELISFAFTAHYCFDSL